LKKILWLESKATWASDVVEAGCPLECGDPVALRPPYENRSPGRIDLPQSNGAAQVMGKLETPCVP